MDVPVFCSHSEMVDIDTIVPNPRNPNHHPDRQLELLAKIIRTQGWRNPIAELAEADADVDAPADDDADGEPVVTAEEGNAEEEAEPAQADAAEEVVEESAEQPEQRAVRALGCLCRKHPRRGEPTVRRRRVKFWQFVR